MTTWRKPGVPLRQRARLSAAGVVCLLVVAAASAPAQRVIQLQPNRTPARTTVLELSKAPLPDALMGRRYAQTFPVEGGTPPYRFKFSGNLPDGMKALVTENTVLIEGVPQVMGDYPLTLSLTDAMGQSQTGTYVLRVTPASTNAPVSITVNEGLKAADSPGSGTTSGSGSTLSILEAIKSADSIKITLNGATTGNSNVFSLMEAIKTADSIKITLNGATTGGSGGISIPESIKAADGITITLNGATTGTGSGPTVPEAIKAKETITITLNGATTGGGGGLSIPESIKAADGITITLNGTTTGSKRSISVPEAVKTADSITITLNGVTTGSGGGFTLSEAIKTVDSITIALNGVTTGSGSGFTVSEAIKSKEAITITLNGATVSGGNTLSVTEAIKTAEAISIKLNGQSTGLAITPTSAPHGVYGTAYSQTFQTTGAAGSVTFGESGSLPQGLTVSTTTGSLIISGTPTVTGSFPITLTANDGTNTASLSLSLVVDKASQTINIGPLPTPTYGGAPFSVSATSTSGLPVTIAYMSGPATGSGSGPYTATGAGVVSFTATQAGNANYTAAAPVNFNVTIASSYIVAVSPNTLSKFGEDGTPFNSSGFTGGGGAQIGAAVDAAGNVFSVSNANSVLVEFNSSGTALSGSGFGGGGINLPAALAIDGAGQVWVANGNSSVSVFTNNGTAVSPSTGYSGVYSAPSGVAIDISGNVWVTNATGNTVTEILGGAAPTAPPSTALTNGTVGTRP